MTRNTLNHCLKFPLHCYGKIQEKNFSTVIKDKLLVSKSSNSCFKGLDFFEMLLASHMQYKYSTSSLSLIKKKRKFTGRLNSKISVIGTSCWSCQQLRLIFSFRTHSISIRLHMQDHKIPFSLFIISVYILTVLVLWNIVVKWSCHGHIMPFSAVQPKRFNVPSQKIEYAYFERWEKCLCIVWNGSFLLFLHFKMAAYKSGLWGQLWKIIFVSISYVISCSDSFKQL